MPIRTLKNENNFFSSYTTCKYANTKKTFVNLVVVSCFIGDSYIRLMKLLSSHYFFKNRTH